MPAAPIVRTWAKALASNLRLTPDDPASSRPGAVDHDRRPRRSSCRPSSMTVRRGIVFVPSSRCSRGSRRRSRCRRGYSVPPLEIDHARARRGVPVAVAGVGAGEVLEPDDVAGQARRGSSCRRCPWRWPSRAGAGATLATCRVSVELSLMTLGVTCWSRSSWRSDSVLMRAVADRMAGAGPAGLGAAHLDRAAARVVDDDLVAHVRDVEAAGDERGVDDVLLLLLGADERDHGAGPAAGGRLRADPDLAVRGRWRPPSPPRSQP